MNMRWQQQLSEAFRSVTALCAYLEININAVEIDKTALSFPVRVPLSFADCMEKGNVNDPLLKQVLPLIAEKKRVPGFEFDPVGDLTAMTETGVIHKYQGRALLINTGSCAIHCRYCFRRNFPYSEVQLNKSTQQQALQYLQMHTELHEIILS
ncbi:MAG: EF-P beta-lysylation protein EpmB, partial [Methylococcales bacterium]|nr:EF-P beta-lysylation protein EpmB [Methylococcales bacterium]